MKTKLLAVFNDLKQLFDMHTELDIEGAAESIRKNINFGGMNIWILVCAIVIASLGLNVNSTAVIIGAMLISPLMGPIIGMGMAVGTDDIHLIRSSLKNFAIMVVISIVASTIFFLITPLDMQHPSELLARTNPTIYDVLIALVGGVAGALEISRKQKSTVISGVAIATALMPPLCTVGYGIANMNIKIAAGAFYLFFINSVFVALATFFVVKALAFPKVSHMDNKIQVRAKRWASVFLVLFIVPSVFSAVSVIRENNFNTSVEQFVTQSRNNLGGAVIYNYKTDTQEKPYHATLYIAGRSLSEGEVETLYEAAEKEYGISRYQLTFEMAIAGENRSELEKQVYSDLTGSIANLKEKIAQYESLELPYDQIDLEMKALYPQIDSISLARGKDKVFAVIRSKEGELPSELISQWLKIRLNCNDLELIFVRNIETD